MIEINFVFFKFIKNFLINRFGMYKFFFEIINRGTSEKIIFNIRVYFNTDFLFSLIFINMRRHYFIKTRINK